MQTVSHRDQWLLLSVARLPATSVSLHCNLCFSLHYNLCFSLHCNLCFSLHYNLCFSLHCSLCFSLHCSLCFPAEIQDLFPCPLCNIDEFTVSKLCMTVVICLTKQHTATCTRNKHIQTKTALTQKYLDLLLLNFLQLFTRLFTLKYKFIEMLLICINIARAKTEIQFLPCDSYAECRQCYATCLCVKCWCCIEMDKCTIKHCSPSDSHTIVVISYQTVWQYSDRDYTIGGIECSWSDF